MKVVMIVAVADNGVIGFQGKIPWRIPEDLPRFKKLTMGHSIIMGRKTYESIGKPLPGRTNIVLTRNQSFCPAGVETCSDLVLALDTCRNRGCEMAFIIGGEEVYFQSMLIVDAILLTEVHQSPVGDARFPSLDKSIWREKTREDHEGFSFVEYVC